MSAGVLPAPPRPAPRPAFPCVLGAAGGVGSSWTGGKGAGECPGEESSSTRLSVTITQPSNTQQPLLSSVLTSNSIQHNPIFPD